MEKAKLEKLLEACKSGCNVKEACLFSEVTDQEFIEHCRLNVGFAEYCELLRLTPSLDSKRTVAQAVKENQDMAFKYLERRDPDFAPKSKSEITGKDGKDLQVNVINFKDVEK